MRLGSENRLDGIKNFGRFGSVFSKPFPTRQTVFRTSLARMVRECDECEAGLDLHLYQVRFDGVQTVWRD
jgi:hypothetical protein